jgi:hypothetical protein
VSFTAITLYVAPQRVFIVLSYEVVSKSFLTRCLEREPQMVQLSATRCSDVAIL